MVIALNLSFSLLNDINTFLVLVYALYNQLSLFQGYVWRLEDGEVMFTMDEWGDSVTEVAWNRDGSMLAAADMAGNIKVWKYPGYKLTWSFELGQDVLWLQWHAQAAVLLAGTAEGQVSSNSFAPSGALGV